MYVVEPKEPDQDKVNRIQNLEKHNKLLAALDWFSTLRGTNDALIRLLREGCLEKEKKLTT